MRVVRVAPKSPAEDGGLRPDDLIVSVNGTAADIVLLGQYGPPLALGEHAGAMLGGLLVALAHAREHGGVRLAALPRLGLSGLGLEARTAGQPLVMGVLLTRRRLSSPARVPS